MHTAGVIRGAAGTTSPGRHARQTYRSDIDGLRGLSVLAVVGFHAFPELFPGGFAGVDVFFVISGYLISRVICQELADGNFDLWRFFGRRILRIFPALIAVLWFCLFIGANILTPQELTQLATHALGGGAFVSNLVLWRESGYFDAAAESKPLLHLWSLGVEEQFYILFPLLLMALSRFRLRLLAPLAAIAALSFLFNVATASGDPAALYFSPLTRCWELLLGALLGVLSLKNPPAVSAGVRTAMSAMGLLLLGLAVFALDKSMPWPGWAALLPVLGAVLLIAGGVDSPVNRAVLSKDWVLQFGLISYALYLWHWPLLTFGRLLWGTEMPAYLRAIAVAVSVVLAGLTFVHLEGRVRNGRNGRNKAALLLVLMGLTVAFSLAGMRSGSLPLRLTDGPQARMEGAVGHAAYLDYLHKVVPPCVPLPEGVPGGKVRPLGCSESIPSATSTVALIGDSHAVHLAGGLAEALPRKNVVLYAFGAMPYVDGSYRDIVRAVVEDPKVTAVVIASRWTASLDATRLRATLEQLTRNGLPVYLLEDVPDFSFDPVRCKFARWSGEEAVCEERRERYDLAREAYLPALAQAASGNPRVRIVDVGKYFCNASHCSMTSGNKLMYRDADHLTIEGSRKLGSHLVEDLPALAH